MPAEDFSNGVEGSGQKWKDRVNTDEAESSYESGATSDAADAYEQAASDSRNEYEDGVADYFGIDSSEVQTGDEYANGVQGAGSSWSQGVQGSGDRWRDGIQRADANEWEQATADAASEWFNNSKEGHRQS